MLSVVMLSVILLSVMAPRKELECSSLSGLTSLV
jgi:hypothetical protein